MLHFARWKRNRIFACVFICWCGLLRTKPLNDLYQRAGGCVNSKKKNTNVDNVGLTQRDKKSVYIIHRSFVQIAWSGSCSYIKSTYPTFPRFHITIIFLTSWPKKWSWHQKFHCDAKTRRTFGPPKLDSGHVDIEKGKRLARTDREWFPTFLTNTLGGGSKHRMATNLFRRTILNMHPGKVGAITEKLVFEYLLVQITYSAKLSKKLTNGSNLPPELRLLHLLKPVWSKPSSYLCWKI